MVQMKDKPPSFDYRTKYSDFDTKTRNFVANFFGVSEYLLLRACEVKIQNGIFAVPEWR